MQWEEEKFPDGGEDYNRIVQVYINASGLIDQIWLLMFLGD